MKMWNRNSSRMLAAALAAFACGGIALRLAWATSGAGITTTIIAGPSELLGKVKVKSDSDVNQVAFEAKGVSDVYVVHNLILPGGHSGWHSHPGPSIISVVSGEATEYRDDDPDAVVHVAGSAFVDEGTHTHLIANEGTDDLVLVAFQILPSGAPRRIDEPAP